MPFSNNNRLTHGEVLSRYFPQYHPVATSQTGLSGGNCIIEHRSHRLVLRCHHDPNAPGSHFLRQYHVLKHLPEGLVPRPHFYTRGWMAVEFFHGKVESKLLDADELAGLLYHPHQQPRSDWRISLLPLLEQYWQCGDPACRTPCWLRVLKRPRKRSEPWPLRLGLLHMDVHGDDIARTASGLRLIDWEYTGDGDITLELAVVWVSDESQRQQLVNTYAQRVHIKPDALQRQVRQWQPWIMMLKAGWFEYHWRQTGDRQFIRLADETWRWLTIKG